MINDAARRTHRGAYGLALSAFTVLAAVGVAAHAGTGSGLGRDLLFIAVLVAATAAVFVGVWLHRPALNRAWLAVGIALGLMALGSLLSVAARFEPLQFLRGYADPLFMAAYLPLFIAAYRFARGEHRADRTVVLDASIVALAALPLVWQFVVIPNITPNVSSGAALMALAMPMVDVALVSMAAPLVLLRFARSPSALLLVAGVAALGLADTQYALDSLRGSPADPMTSVLWLVAYLLLGASALVPSARGLGSARDPSPSSRDLPRLLALAIALLVSPFVTLIATAREGSVELVILAVLSFVLAMLVSLRLQRTVGQLAAGDQRFRRFMSHGGLMAAIKDDQGRYIFMNPSAGNVRRADEAWYGRTDRDLFPPDVAARRGAADAEVRRSGLAAVETEVVDGRVWHTERFSAPGAKGEIGILGVDITDRVAAEEACRLQAVELARLAAAIENATDAVVVTDPDDRVVYVNPAFERMTGFPAGELLGRRPIDEPSGRALARALEQAKGRPGAWRGDVVDRRKDGSDLITQTSISPIVTAGEATHGYVTIKRDVTRERAAERAAERGARERLLIAETLGALRAGLSPEATARAVCEQILKLPEAAIATVLTFGADGLATVLEQVDRTGGGTSCVALPRERSDYLRSRAAAGPWVERWATQETHPYAPMFDRFGILAHGYAPILDGGRPIGLLIIGSDMIDAIDRMAERLPAIVEFAAITGTLLGGAMADRIVIAEQEAEMRSIIERRAFHSVFQPIVELATGKVRGHEALTRFSDGTTPDIRFDQAHRLGAGLALEVACLEASFAAAEHLPATSWLNVNVSPQVILAGLLEGVLPRCSREIVIEITEHEAITDYASFRAAVDPIRDRVQIAVDDAGAGFASLRHIVELAPAMVKLDRSLIAGIDADPAREAVVSGMVRFSAAAGLVLLAEGIETRDELATLRRLGVQLGQGYLLGMPARLDATAAASPAVRPGRRRAPATTDAELVRASTPAREPLPMASRRRAGPLTTPDGREPVAI